MNHRLGAGSVYLAIMLLAGCSSAPLPAGVDIQARLQALRSYSAMGADDNLAFAMDAVEQACPLRMADALAAAVKEIDGAPERIGRPPAMLDAPDPQSFINLYNRIAAEKPRIDPKRLLRHAVEGMTNALDPESTLSGYMDLSFMKGPFASVGLEMRSEAGGITIINTIPNSPASHADIEAGDRVIAVDETEVTGLYLDEVVDKLRGEEGSSIELTIRRDGRAGDLKIPLMRRSVQPLNSRPELHMQGRIAVITLPTFDELTPQRLAEVIRQAQQAQAASYIIDIRKNGGGLLDKIVETASIFLETGRVLSTAPPAECGSTEPPANYNVQRGFKLKDSPVIVLIGKDTSSGAEPFAATLLESGRARLVGQKTAGIGTVHTVIPLGNSISMRVKTSELLTSQGARIAGVGVKPTIEVAESEDALAYAFELLVTP